MRRILLGFLLVVAAPSVLAKTDFNLGCMPAPGGCVFFQKDFHAITEDITGGFNYKALGPAEATGVSGVSGGVFATYTPVENKSAWKNVTGSNVNYVGMVGVAVRKGLPFDIDVGATYSAVPQTSVRLYGFEARYAFLPGTVAIPAVALRAAYTGSTGIDQFSFNTTSVDLSISKGFTLFTPYAGVGYVRGKTKPDASTGLKDETVNKAKFFLGMRLGLGLLDITPEYERVGSNNSYGLHLGLSI